MRYPIVIPLHPDGGKFKDNSELRYALRSLEKHFTDEFEIAIVSKKLPDWIQGVRHIYGEGLKSSLHNAAKEYPDGFFWWYDDNCLLLPTDGETMKATPIAHHWSKPSSEWRKQLEKVRVRLQEEGLPCHDYSSPHGPYWFDLAMVQEGFADWSGMSGKFPWETWILSKHNWPTVKGQTSQYYGKFKTPPGPQHRYLNYNDGGNTKEIRRYLDGAFRVSTRFEKPDPEFDYQGRVRGVVISLPQRPRWEDACISAMTEVGIDVDRFEGTDAHMGDVPVMPVSWKLFEKEFKRTPLAGEIGCYSSHIKIAQARETLPALCDEFPDWHLVFEDDALPRNIDAAKLVAIVRMAVESGYDLVMLNIGRDNRRLNRAMSISPSRRKDPFTHAYVASKKALSEMSGWSMRHPIDLAISKSNKLRIGLLGGKHRFEQQRNADSTFSIHRERKGEVFLTSPVSMETKPDDFSLEEFNRIIVPWSAHSAEDGTDKITRHGYGEMYAEILGPLRGKSVSLLEIGVKTGASLMAWRDYLGPQASIVGVDVDLKMLKHANADVVLADATTLSFAETLKDESLDIIIDDGSHRVEDQWVSFRNLWSKLKVGGRYIIEDINNERVFKEMAGAVNFRYIDKRDQFASDDLCAIHTRSHEEKPPRQPGDGVIIADCACSQKRGLGNHITSICAAYAAAWVRGWEMVVVWRPSQRADCEWEDLFLPMEGVEVLKDYPKTGVKQLACYYSDRAKPEHLRTAGPCRYTAAYWEAWKRAARLIRLQPDLELPDYGKFDAISLRLAHPPQKITEWWVDCFPDMDRPFVSSDCRAGFDIVRKRFPDARFLSDTFQQKDDAHRGVEHMRSAARDMLMLCRAQRILTVGRDSTFRNLAHIGHGVPVMKVYGGPAP